MRIFNPRGPAGTGKIELLGWIQPAHFGRVYAASGGFFIALLLLWGWLFDGDMKGRLDILAYFLNRVGVIIIMSWPR